MRQVFVMMLPLLLMLLLFVNSTQSKGTVEIKITEFGNPLGLKMDGTSCSFFRECYTVIDFRYGNVYKGIEYYGGRNTFKGDIFTFKMSFDEDLYGYYMRTFTIGGNVVHYYWLISEAFYRNYDLIEDFEIALFQVEGTANKNGTFTEVTQPLSNQKYVKWKYAMTCDKNYYGKDCEIYCKDYKPGNDTARCNEYNGHAICNIGRSAKSKCQLSICEDDNPCAKGLVCSVEKTSQLQNNVCFPMKRLNPRRLDRFHKQCFAQYYKAKCSFPKIPEKEEKDEEKSTESINKINGTFSEDNY